MCNVIADTSAIAHSLHPLEGLGGEDYYRLDFNVVLLFGLTELKAQISWIDGVRPVLVSRLQPCAEPASCSRAWRRGTVRAAELE